jgi:hypothetical protein
MVQRVLKIAIPYTPVGTDGGIGNPGVEHTFDQDFGKGPAQAAL